jgi:DNA-binding MarR family transcriptional regulator
LRIPALQAHQDTELKATTVRTPNRTADTQGSTARDFPASWAIYSLARSHRALAASMLSELGLFPSQELILMQLWDEDGQSQKALGQTQRFDHSTIAKSVRRLETAGLIRREKSPHDGRVTLVFLTEAGQDLKSRTLQIWEELERKTVQSLTAEEQAQLVRLAQRIIPNLE